MLQTHSSYTGRISPGAPFLTYLPQKPKPQPFGGSQQAGVPTQPGRKHDPPPGSRQQGLESTH